MSILVWKPDTLITTPGIYHNANLGLISLSSDGINWITIADKNLGATQVYHQGDVMSLSNSGNYFQRGNNYGFGFDTISVGSLNPVDASSYGPGNYYNSSTWIGRNGAWCMPTNDNLWGNVTDTNIARQGPCPAGFHIPSLTEANYLVSLMSGFGFTNISGYSQYLFVPPSGTRQDNATLLNRNTSAGFWTTTPSSQYANFLHMQIGSVGNNIEYQSAGCNIRPFSNTPIQPDDGGDWTELYNTNDVIITGFNNHSQTTAGLNVTGLFQFTCVRNLLLKRVGFTDLQGPISVIITNNNTNTIIYSNPSVSGDITVNLQLEQNVEYKIETTPTSSNWSTGLGTSFSINNSYNISSYIYNYTLRVPSYSGQGKWEGMSLIFNG